MSSVKWRPFCVVLSVLKYPYKKLRTSYTKDPIDTIMLLSSLELSRYFFGTECG